MRWRHFSPKGTVSIVLFQLLARWRTIVPKQFARWQKNQIIRIWARFSRCRTNGNWKSASRKWDKMSGLFLAWEHGRATEDRRAWIRMEEEEEEVVEMWDCGVLGRTFSSGKLPPPTQRNRTRRKRILPLPARTTPVVPLRVCRPTVPDWRIDWRFLSKFRRERASKRQRRHRRRKILTNPCSNWGRQDVTKREPEGIVSLHQMPPHLEDFQNQSRLSAANPTAFRPIRSATGVT